MRARPRGATGILCGFWAMGGLLATKAPPMACSYDWGPSAPTLVAEDLVNPVRNSRLVLYGGNGGLAADALRRGGLGGAGKFIAPIAAPSSME